MEHLEAGIMTTLKVEREASFGYFLSNGHEDVLLHDQEILKDLHLGELIEVFLFQDKLGRLAATMKKPTITNGTYGWVEVVDVKEDLGVFIHIGTSKDILIHKNDLPKMKHVWPTIGGKLYCTLKTDKQGRLLGKIATEKEMESLFIKASRSEFNKNISGIVYRTLRSGSFIITNEGYRGFIHESQREEEPRLGSNVQGRIIDVKNDGSINVSLLKRSHEAIIDDANKILSYLNNRGGVMPLTDHSLPEEIQNKFGMSKGAFKRAIGYLMKQGKVYQNDGWTYLKW